MVDSTEDTVSAEILEALEGNWADFGFENAPGNFHDTLLNAQPESGDRRLKYLMVSENGAKRARAIGFYVTSNELPGSDQGTRIREYQIVIEIYKSWAGGDDVKWVRNAARKVRGIINATRNLGGTVDFLSDASDLQTSVLETEGGELSIYVGSFGYTGSVQRADF